MPEADRERGSRSNPVALPALAEKDRQGRRVPMREASLARSAGIAVISVVGATLAGLGIDHFIQLPNISLVFLLAVLAAAGYAGYAPALMAAVLSTFAYNFFFIDPLYTLKIAAPHQVFALLVFLAAALIAGSLASRIRQQAEAAKVRATTVQALYEFARKLSGTAKADDVLWTAVTQLQASLRHDVVILLPEHGTLKLAAAWPPDAELTIAEMTAAHWAHDKQETAGRGTGTLPGSAFQFRPLITPHGAVGVCGFELGEEALDTSAERAISALLDQTAIAIDRARLSQETLEQAARLESERHRAALLSSVSHDLRTPLSSITGAVTSLRQLGDRMSPESRDDLLQSIEEESGRLSRFVTNLLDMSKIEAGMLEIPRDWVDVADAVQASVARARRYFPNRRFVVDVAAGLPLIQGDSVLLGQVLFNLLDNAAKYGGDAPVGVEARQEEGDVAISVCDRGRGIPAQDLERVFDKFYRRGKADGRAPGTGLGLAIARGFVETMGGRIHAESPALKGRGTRMVMRFPAARLPAGKDTP